MKNSSEKIHLNKSSKIQSILVWAQIWIHVLRGICTLSFIFPFLVQEKKHKKIQEWSKRLLDIFNIELVVQDAMLLGSIPNLIVSNHISWLDIHVINAFKPTRFVAKSEVASWPIFGWMATQLGTVFIRRDSARHARLVVANMVDVLKTQSICIFPEGTSTIGSSVLPFKPNLFESAIIGQTPVYPIAIQYLSKMTGLRSESPAFIGDMGLLESMSKIIHEPYLIAQITILPPCFSGQNSNIDRKELAKTCQELIAKTL